MLSFYEQEGGLVSGDRLACIAGGLLSQPLSVVARWIVDRRVISLSNGVQLLLPLFQFDFSRMTMRPAVETALSTGGAFGG